MASPTSPGRDTQDVDKEMATMQDHIVYVVEIPLVDRNSFAIVMGCIVIANVICIGFETEYTNRGDIFGMINNSFLLIYIVELMIRMLTHGLKAFRDVFTVTDLILVLLAFLERIMSTSSLARALPTFRTFRMFRLLRKSSWFEHQKELRSIIVASVRMVRTIIWVVPLLFLFLWICATVAHMVIGSSAEWNGTLDPRKTFDPFVPFDIQQYFGSVWKSFVTLVQVMTLSQWAPHIGRRIVKVYPITFMFFVVFIVVCTYAILVSIVANLVQDSMEASRVNELALKEKAREQRRMAGYKARDILAEVDADGSGDLDADEIAYALEYTDLAHILTDLGVPVTDADGLVRLLDFNGNGLVSYDELVEGVVRMDEDITKRDFAMMGFWVKNLLERTRHLEERLGKLCDKVSLIRIRLSGSFGSLNHLIKTSKDSQMRQRAIHRLRTSGPELPPEIEKKIVIKRTIPRDTNMELQASLGRFLGTPPQPKRAGSPGLDAPRTVHLFNNTMQAAPPRLDVGLRRAKREERKHQDKYQIGKDGHIDVRRNPENPNLTALKQLM